LSLPAGWLLVALGLLVGAVLFWSPGLAALAVLGASLEILRRLTDHSERSAKTLLLLLLLLLPVGLAWDGRLDGWMIRASSRAGSRFLDFLGYDHVLVGSVLRVPDQQWTVDTILSGIFVPFTLVAAAAILAVWLRCPLVHGMLMLVAGGFWTGIGNVLCMTCVVAAHDRYGWDLSAGWGHAALGAGWLLVGLSMLFCTDRLLLSLLAPIPLDGEEG
jgi:hypothetical protein